jgi:simple sugar transport system permease protein
MFIESVGVNARSSFFSGIDEKKIKLLVYVFCGMCAGIAGMIAVSSIRTSDANQVGLYCELDAILAVIIGGTLMSGGRFSLLASIIGALVIQATTTSSLAFGVPANALIAVKAVVVIVVILLYSQQVQDFFRKLTSQAGKEAKS